MTDSGLDDDIIDSLRKSSMHKKCFKYDRERGRIFIVRKNDSKKNCTDRGSCRSMCCGDHAPLPNAKSCQLKITEPIICTISDPCNIDDECDNDVNCCNSDRSIPPACADYKRCIDKCSAKLNVKKTSRAQLPSRCSCCCHGSGNVNLARKLLGPFPDEIGLSLVDKIAKMFGKAIGCDNEMASCERFRSATCKPSRCRRRC